MNINLADEEMTQESDEKPTQVVPLLHFMKSHFNQEEQDASCSEKEPSEMEIEEENGIDSSLSKFRNKLEVL